MAQLSLYLDDATMEALRATAASKDVSLSEFSRETLKRALETPENPWPKSLWEAFGAIDDDTFVEPEEIPWEYDAPRLSFD